MRFNQRSHALILRHFGSRWMAHRRLLRSVFKAAYDRHRVNPNPVQKLIAALQNDVTYQQWTFLRSVAVRKRKVEHRQQSRLGNIPWWEGVLVKHVGEDWRDIVERGWLGWKQHEKNFVNGVCKQYGLPQLPGTRTSEAHQEAQAGEHREQAEDRCQVSQEVSEPPRKRRNLESEHCLDELLVVPHWLAWPES